MTTIPKQPYLGQWQLSLQQQLPATLGLTAAYIASRGMHLWGGSGFINNYLRIPPVGGASGNKQIPIFDTTAYKIRIE